MTVAPITLPTVLPNLLFANWRAQVQVETVSRTSVVAGRGTQAEERRQLTRRPGRTMTVTVTGMTREQAGELWQNVQAIADRRTVLPLYCDQALTTSTSTGQYINVDTTLYRFFAGGRVVIFTPTTAGPSAVEYVRAEAVTATQLDLGSTPADQLQVSHPAGSYVFPLLDIEINLSSSRGVLETDGLFEVQFEADEVLGASALPYLETGLPTGFPTYLGYPILTTPLNWGAAVSVSTLRAGQSFEVGRGQVVSPLGDRPQAQYEGEIFGGDRESAWEILTFFESRAGRLRPFWLLSPQTEFEIYNTNAAYVDVLAVGNIEDALAFTPAIAIEVTGGTVIVREVTNIALQAPGIWRITLATSITAPAVIDVVRITAAHLVRLREDSFLERWTTDGVVSFSFAAQDVLNDESVTITGLELPAFDLGPVVEIDDLYLWASAQGNMWSDNDGGGLTATDPTKAFPEGASGNETDIDFVFDSRQAADDPSLTAPYLERTSSSGAPQSARFSHFHLSAGQRVNYHFNVTAYAGWLLRNSQAPFWDAVDGMTVFLVGRFAGPASISNPQKHLYRSGVFEWTQDTTDGGQVRFFAVADAVVAAANISYTQPDDSALRIWAVRWNPGVSAAIYKNGGTALATAATPAASLSAVARDADVMTYLGNNFGAGDGLPQNIDQNLDRQCFTADFLIYKRALTAAEMNVVGNWLQQKYAAAGVVWNTVP